MKVTRKCWIALITAPEASHRPTSAREMTKLGAVIQVPFRAGNQFLGEGGLQDIFYNIRDKTRTIADQHANFAKTVDSSLVQHLQKLLLEIKAHIKNVQNDTGRLATAVAKERELSTKVIADLARSIAMFKNTPMSIQAKDDPYCQNVLVAKQLQKQVCLLPTCARELAADGSWT